MIIIRLIRLECCGSERLRKVNTEISKQDSLPSETKLAWVGSELKKHFFGLASSHRTEKFLTFNGEHCVSKTWHEFNKEQLQGQSESEISLLKQEVTSVPLETVSNCELVVRIHEMSKHKSSISLKITL